MLKNQPVKRKHLCTWEGSGSVLGWVMWMMWVMMRWHAAHGARWVEWRHGVERGHHGGGEEGRRWKWRGRRRRAGQVDAFEDCLTHLLDLGHQLLLQSRKKTETEPSRYRVIDVKTPHSPGMSEWGHGIVEKIK